MSPMAETEADILKFLSAQYLIDGLLPTVDPCLQARSSSQEADPRIVHLDDHPTYRTFLDNCLHGDDLACLKTEERERMLAVLEHGRGTP